MKARRVVSMVLTILSVAAATVCWLMYVLWESALDAVLDAGATGLAVGALAVGLAGAGLLLLRGREGMRTWRVAAVGAVVAASVAVVLLVPLRLLSHRSEDVTFINGSVVLAGTLYQPRGGVADAAVVLVHGSGPESRREYAFYARYLARRGIAALAYDKRGVGESTGHLYRSDYHDYAGDAAAGVQLLASRSDIDAGGIGLVGFSEGEWVAPLAAARSTAVAFVVVIGAAGTSPAEQVASEMALRLRARGHPDSVVQHVLALNERVFDYQRHGTGGDELTGDLAAATSEAWFRDAEDIPSQLYAFDEYAWWRSVMDFDAARAWSQVQVPVLLIKGGRDDRSAADVMQRRIGQVVPEARLDVRVYPDADHMLLVWPRGERTPPPRFAAGYLDGLVEWVKRQAAAGERRTVR